MKHSLKSLIDFTTGATDGEIGDVKEFYFDDETWTIRYLKVGTDNWRSRGVVLISTSALLAPDWKNKLFPGDLSKEQIRNSPEMNKKFPVSGQQEIRLNQYYPWASYWEVGEWASVPLLSINISTKESEVQKQPKVIDRDKHLRSTDRVIGYNIKTIVGDVEDFFIDTSNWSIQHMIVDAGNWFPGKKVTISPDLIKEINWEISGVIINASVEHVKNNPEYDAYKQLSTAYESILKN
jgi:hypothetical protein